MPGSAKRQRPPLEARPTAPRIKFWERGFQENLLKKKPHRPPKDGSPLPPGEGTSRSPLNREFPSQGIFLRAKLVFLVSNKIPRGCGLRFYIVDRNFVLRVFNNQKNERWLVTFQAIPFG
ncbi:hypothetical protein ACJJTC_014221 [Scirpophaga incertulas]